MPPQWNPYEEIPEAPLPPLVAERGPLDDILAGVPMAPVQPARPLQAIPDDLVSMVPVLPPPPAPLGVKPQPVDDGIPEPPRRTAKPQPVESLYEIPAPPKVAPADLAPDFTGVNLARALDVVEAPPSVDVTGSAQRAQTAERNLTTFTAALGEAQADAVAVGEQLVPLEQHARALDERIAALKGKKKRTADEERALSAMQVTRKSLTPQIDALKPRQEEATARFNMAREQAQTAKQVADQAHMQARTDTAIAEREAEVKGQAAQEAGAALFAQRSKEIADDATAQLTKIEAEEGAARARMDEDRKVYREALKTGPAKTSMVLTVASVIAEALAARHTGREPNFGSVIGQLEQATKGEFDDRVQRQLALIAESEDSLAKAAQQKRVIDAQKAERRAEILATIEMDIQSKMAGARGTAREAQLAMVAGDVRKAKEAAEHQALIEQQKAAQANEKARLDRELQEAQIRKAEAEAAEKEAEAARKAGAEGEKKSEAWSSRDPNKVYVPFSNTELAVFDGANADKRAEKAGALVTDGFKYMKTLYEYEAMVEDYGTRKVFDRSGWTESDEYRKLATKHARLRTALAKVIAGQGFSTTESDMRAAEKMAPLPTTWNDTTRAALEQMRKDGDDDFRLTLNQAVDTRAQETLIREARRFGTSQTELQRALVDRAPEVLTDANRPLDARLGALKALGENLRKGKTGDSEQIERDAILAELNVLKRAEKGIAATEIDPDDASVDSEGNLTGVSDDASEVLQAIRARKQELAEIWRKVGTSGMAVTRREQRDIKAGPGPKPSKIGGLL
jgi:hypothetical protein